MKNFKLSKKLFALALSGSLCGTALTGCGNKDMWDSEKSYNIAIDESNGAVSIVSIIEYDDYSGEQIQVQTTDGLTILTSSKDTQLVKQNDLDKLKEYAASLVNGDEDKIIFYDTLQGNDLDISKDSYNKSWWDGTYTYEKGIIENEEGITLVDIKQWTDYEDDKIQIILTDGTVLLEYASNLKLVSMGYADLESFYNYAYSLVGDEDKINYYSSEPIKKLTNTEE